MKAIVKDAALASSPRNEEDVIVDFDSISDDHKSMIQRLELVFQDVRTQITEFLSRAATSPSPHIAEHIIDLLPVRIVKVQLLNQEDSFADQMKSLHTMKSMNRRKVMRARIIELLTRFLE